MAISAPRFGETVGELLALPRGLGHRLKAKVRDHSGGEALPILEAHGIENTSIGIDTNEKTISGVKKPKASLCSFRLLG